MLILLTFYLLENDRRSVETLFFIRDFTVLSFKTLIYDTFTCAEYCQVLISNKFRYIVATYH